LTCEVYVVLYTPLIFPAVSQTG